MEKIKYETDCKYPFFISCKAKIMGIKSCEIRLENGRLLTYMPVPHKVRFTFPSITRFYKSKEGQRLIENELNKREERLKCYMEKKGECKS